MYEDLSRLLAGELDEAEASALRARIAADPALAAAYQRMVALPGQVAALRDGPPPRLMAPPRPRRTWAWAAAAAALAAVLAGRAGQPAELSLASGVIFTDGAFAITVPGGQLTGSGKIRVDVEPNAPLPRDIGVEDPMSRSHLLSAAAGAVLTVAVYEGRAHFEPSDESAGAQAADLGPGERRVLAGKAPPDPHAAQPEPGADEALSTDELQARVKALELQLAVTRGQLAAVEGTPQPWPENLPAAYKPEAFEATARDVAKAVPGTRLVEVDCSEYPCVAFFTKDDPDQDWNREIAGAFPEDGSGRSSVWQLGSAEQTPSGVRGATAISVTQPTDSEEARAIGQRLQIRAQPVMEDLMAPQEPPPEAP